MLFINSTHDNQSTGIFTTNKYALSITLKFVPTDVYIIPGWEIQIFSQLGNSNVFVPHSSTLDRAFKQLNRELEKLCSSIP